MFSALAIQSYCLACQQSGKLQFDEENMEWSHADNDFGYKIEITDNGFIFCAWSQGSYKTEPVLIKNLKHLQSLKNKLEPSSPNVEQEQKKEYTPTERQEKIVGYLSNIDQEPPKVSPARKAVIDAAAELFRLQKWSLDDLRKSYQVSQQARSIGELNIAVPLLSAALNHIERHLGAKGEAVKAEFPRNVECRHKTLQSSMHLAYEWIKTQARIIFSSQWI